METILGHLVNIGISNTLPFVNIVQYKPELNLALNP